MRIKLIAKHTYEISLDDKVIGKFDRYDLDRLDNAQIGASLIFLTN